MITRYSSWSLGLPRRSIATTGWNPNKSLESFAASIPISEPGDLQKTAPPCRPTHSAYSFQWVQSGIWPLLIRPLFLSLPQWLYFFTRSASILAYVRFSPRGFCFCRSSPRACAFWSLPASPVRFGTRDDRWSDALYRFLKSIKNS